MQALIREGRLHQATGLIETNRSGGMFTLDTFVKQLHDENVITREEALRYMRNPRALES